MNCTFCGKVLDKTAPIVAASRFCLYRNGYWVEVTRAAAHVKCHEQHQQSKLRVERVKIVEKGDSDGIQAEKA